MKKLVLITAVLLSTALNSNAQYSMMTKGERCPFDSAVAIHIDTYRMETRKMRLADTLIVNLSYQVHVLEAARDNLQYQLTLNRDKIRLKEDEVRLKQQTIESLLKQLEHKPAPTWWEKNHRPALLIGGVTIGIAGSLLLLNSLR